MTSWENLDILPADEERILENKKCGRIYVADFKSGEGKYISTVIEDATEPYDVKLQISPKIEVRLTYIQNGEHIDGVQITKLSGKKLEKVHLSTLGFEGVLGILRLFSELDLKSISNRSIILDTNIIENESELRTHLNTILADEKGLKMIAELASSRGLITEGDIGNISKKRDALDLFAKLLYEDAFFDSKKMEWHAARDEDIWQKFFEDNKWIFGYGLEYVFNAPISKDKFQQTLIGNSFTQPGKKPDGILKTLGLTQFLNIVEIKTHRKKLMDSKMYRTSNVWQISNELSGALAQCQQYVRTSLKNLEEIIDIKDDNGNRTGEEVFCLSPKCFLVVGSMKTEFLNDKGEVENPDKLASFEYFRKNTLLPEIITFDQLYYRAKNILETKS